MQIVGTRYPQNELYNSHVAVGHPFHKWHPFSIAAQKSNLWTTDKIIKIIKNYKEQNKKNPDFNLVSLALLCYNTLDNGRLSGKKHAGTTESVFHLCV